MTKDAARQHIIDSAAIEFDPAVVTALLSLQGLEEMQSFAGAEEPPVASREDDGVTLFSSFMK